MKILTNTRTYRVAGITQTLASFADFIEKNKGKVHITGVDIVSQKSNYQSASVKQNGSFSMLSFLLDYPANIIKVAREAKDLREIETVYEPLIEKYEETIKQESPDAILINGTYFLPWCLLKAALRRGLPIVLHYHGILSKETAHWNPCERELMLAMEKSFDRENIYYVFPSHLAKDTVEKEVFGHGVKKFSLLPNPVPAHFFKKSPGKRIKKQLGMISRWSKVKNTDFLENLAEFNDKSKEMSLNVVTDLPRQHKTRIKLGGLVKFRQPMPNDKLPFFYQKMGVVISPSHFETYGNVAQEAVACGTPALVSRHMGVAETFQNLGLGDWVIDFDSLSAVATKIKEVRGMEVSVSVKKKIKEEYCSDKIHPRLLEVLRSI